MAQYGAYCTQIGPDGSGHERCGGACIASVLLDDGWESDPWALTQQVSDDCGFTGRGATIQGMIACGQRHGLAARPWFTAEDAKDALTAGEAVVALLNNRYLVPRTYPPGDAWNALHYIRIVYVSPEEQLAYCYDPLTWQPQPDGTVYQGPVASTLEGILDAIRHTPVPEAGVIYTSQQGRRLNGV